jgi:hypothetical protein
MTLVPRPQLALPNIIAPLVVSPLFIPAMSLLREPDRKRLSALLIADAGAVYFGAGFGWWEVGFCALFTWLAFKGWNDYRFVGIGWLLHIGWDILHHLYGRSILPFLPLSSAGCAICDTGIAIWYFVGAPSFRRQW